MRRGQLGSQSTKKQFAPSQPLRVRAQPGYYPGFDTLSQKAFWDRATRDVVLRRLEKHTDITFFTPIETGVFESVLNRILPQDDRDQQHRIPLLSTIDERLAKGRIDGYRFAGMPSDHEAYRLGLSAIDEMAVSLHGRNFSQLGVRQQEELLKSLHDGRPIVAHPAWERMPVHRFWMLMLQDAIEAYYAHPFAWNEIGFGGPAYPRAYMRLERGAPEPWEVDEEHYEWSAPEDSISDVFEPIANQDEHLAPPGQGGTH